MGTTLWKSTLLEQTHIKVRGVAAIFIDTALITARISAQ